MSDRLPQQRTKTVAKPDEALADYLDTLLSEIDGDVVETSPVVTTKAETTQADILLKSDADPRVVQETAVRAAADAVPPSPEIPAWAETPFQVLTFSVGRVKLAVPLSSLNGILTMEAKLTQLPGQPDWSMGVAINHESKVIVVDTQQVLMPEQVTEESAPFSSKHILLIGEGTRGLAVESLQGTELMDKSAIRWRGAKGNHPWYAGIVTEKLTVMIDVDGLMEMLAA